MLKRGSQFLPGLLILMWPLAAQSGPREEPAAGEVVRLEPVFVEASSPNPWEYFTVPGFEVISHCPDDFNQTYARALRRATAARAALLPAGFWGEMPTPIKIVLYNRPPEHEADFSQAKPIDLQWGSADPAIVGSDSLRQSHPAMVGDGDTFISCGNYWNLISGSGDFYVDPDSAIRIRNRVPRFPTWFEAGLEGPLGLYANRAIESAADGHDFVVLPNALWTSRAETIAIRKDPAHPRWLLPLGRLFGGGVPAGLDSAWYAEAALFVRWGLYFREADGRDYRQAFLDFADRSTREPVTEPLFRSFFGMGFAEAQERLGRYLPSAVGASIRVPIAASPEGAVEIREARSTEVARIIGDWGRFEGKTLGPQNMAYARECMDSADRLFERNFARGPSDPLFLAAFGLYALQVGDTVRARDALETATGAGVTRPRAYLELARLRLDDSLPFYTQGIGDLSAGDYKEVLGLVTTARKQMPSLEACYQLLARAIEHAPARPTREDMAVLDEAVHLFPGDAPLAYKVATLYKRFGYPGEARAVIGRAMGFADSADARAQLTSFVAQNP